MSVNHKNPTKVVTGVVRLSYANVWEPASINGSNPKYSVSLIIPKTDTKTIDAINAAVDAAIKDGAAKFGGKIPNKAALKLPLRATSRRCGTVNLWVVVPLPLMTSPPISMTISFPNNHPARVAEGDLCRPYVAGKEIL